MEAYKHNKTGNLYFKLFDAIDATNSRDGNDVAVYSNTQGQVFVRDKEEFLQKFTKIEAV